MISHYGVHYGVRVAKIPRFLVDRPIFKQRFVVSGSNVSGELIETMELQEIVHIRNLTDPNKATGTVVLGNEMVIETVVKQLPLVIDTNKVSGTVVLGDEVVIDSIFQKYKEPDTTVSTVTAELIETMELQDIVVFAGPFEESETKVSAELTNKMELAEI